MKPSHKPFWRSKALPAFLALTLSSTAFAYDCTGLKAWSTSDVYVGGNIIQHQGVAYKANWWTLNQNPLQFSGQWQEWTSLGACDGTGGTNKSPTAKVNGPYAGSVGGTVAFSSAGSTDPDGTITAYTWSFGDGKTSSAENPTNAYTAAGTYTVSLTVRDDKGATASATTNAVISGGSGNNQLPRATINGPYTGTAGGAIAFKSTGSSDPDGTITGFSWNFGDGGTSTEANPSHVFAAAGTYTVRLTVTDNAGGAGSSTTTATVSPGSSGPGGNKVIGYFTEWGVYGRNYHVKNLHTSGAAQKLTHIVYAFGNVQNGRCTIGDSYADYDKYYAAGDSVDGVSDTWDAGALRGNFAQLKRLKKMYPNLKVVWSFGGWTWSGGFTQAAQDPATFANSCFDLVNDSRWAGVFDGIDIDWEYPNECGLNCDGSGFDGYRRLMQALRGRFGSQLVTSAITSAETKLNAADYAGAAQFVDFYMVMTYDFFGSWNAAGPTAPHSALSNYSGIPVAGFYSDKAVQVLKAKGVPSAKILLGLGFYGRGWQGVSQAAPGGSASGPAPGTYEQGIEDYKVLKQRCPATGTVGGTAYAFCNGQWWSFDTPDTISGKTNYIKQQSLGGAFFWELSGDTADAELVKAIGNGLGR